MRGVWVCWCGCVDVGVRGAVCGCAVRGCVGVDVRMWVCAWAGVWACGRVSVGVGVCFFFFKSFQLIVFEF